MARVHHVKKARKDNPVAKKGESYYWWKPRVNGRGGAIRYSKTYPSRSQTTQSEFLSAAYDIADASIPGCENADGFRAVAEEIRTLGQEQQDKFDNMPEGLQQGDTGQLLEERAYECESWADELDRIADELGDGEPAGDDDENGDDEDDEESWDDRLQNAISEAQDLCPF